MKIAQRIILLLMLSATSIAIRQNDTEREPQEVHVGVIPDLGSMIDKITNTGFKLAMEDFYVAHQNYSTQLVLHIRDSLSDDVQAAAQGRCSETFSSVYLFVS
jgi:glutamate receptor, ionotropic, plant